MEPITLDTRVGEHKVAELSNYSVNTIRSMRLRRVGPRFYKHGTRVVYKMSDVFAWLDDVEVAAKMAYDDAKEAE